MLTRGGACLYGSATPAILGGEDLASPVFGTPSNPLQKTCSNELCTMIQQDERKTYYTVGGSVFKILCDTNVDARSLCAVVNSFLLQYRYKRELVTFSGAIAFLNLKTIK